MRICKVIIPLALTLMAGGLFAQSNGKTSSQVPMPEMPAMPEMPTVGGGFYTPSFPSRVKSSKKTETANEKEKEKNEAVLT